MRVLIVAMMMAAGCTRGACRAAMILGDAVATGTLYNVPDGGSK